MREHAGTLIDTMASHKDALIEEKGQEWWDETMAGYDQIDRQGEKIDAIFAELAESEEPVEDSDEPPPTTR